MKIIIVIPTYNEKENINSTISALEKVFKNINKHSFNILVVDDNSPDGTADVVLKNIKKYKNIDLLKGKKEGLGAAYVRGFKYAMGVMKADIVFEFDADGQHDPMYLSAFVKKLEGGYDYVIGSRYVKGGSIPSEWGFHRKIVSKFGSLFARVVLGNMQVKDYTSGYKASRVKGFLDKVDLDNLFSKRHAYKIHILNQMLALGAKTCEVPISFKSRTNDESKSTFEDFIESLKVVLKIRYKKSERFIKVCLVGATGAFVQFVAYYLFKHFFASFSGITFKLLQNLIYISEKAFFTSLAVELAILVNFIINNIWTFKDSKIKVGFFLIPKFLQFNFFVLGSLVIQAVVLEVGTRVTGIDNNFFDFILISIGILIGLIYNYFIYQKIIWKIKKK